MIGLEKIVSMMYSNIGLNSRETGPLKCAVGIKDPCSRGPIPHGISYRISSIICTERKAYLNCETNFFDISLSFRMFTQKIYEQIFIVNI